MKHLFLLLALLPFRQSFAQSCDCETLSGNLTTNKTLLSTECYELSGCYKVTSGHTLTIQAGTKVFAGSGSALYVEPGADLVAVGTSNNPIIFTSAVAPNSRDYGDWDGIYIAGNASNNRTNNEIELERSCTVAGGGSTDNDNSGTLQYIQLHYSQNGLNLVSVGSGTTIDHIEVTYSAKDGFQFYGGTVNVSNLVSYNVKRSDFFATYGYRGKMQFLLGFRQDINAHDASGSYGMLSTNDETGTSATPVTRPVISNMTILGPRYCSGSTLSTDFQDAVRIAENASTSIYNSLLGYWRQYGLYLDDASTMGKTSSDDLNFSYNTFDDQGVADYSHSGTWAGCGSDMQQWIEGDPFVSCSETGNEFSPVTTLGYSSVSICGSGATKNFALGTTTMSGPTFSGVSDLNDAFFDDAVTFRGAVGATDWTSGWTNWAPQATNYCGEQMKLNQDKGGKLVLSPNPATRVVYARFSSEEAGTVRISVLDKISGTELLVQQGKMEKAGKQNIALHIGALREGVYIVKVTTRRSSMFGQLIVK